MSTTERMSVEEFRRRYLWNDFAVRWSAWAERKEAARIAGRPFHEAEPLMRDWP